MSNWTAPTPEELKEREKLLDMCANPSLYPSRAANLINCVPGLMSQLAASEAHIASLTQWRDTASDPPPENEMVLICRPGFSWSCAKRVGELWFNDNWHCDVKLSEFPLWKHGPETPAKKETP